MQGELGKRSWAMVLCLAFAVSGCQRQKGSDNGKTYTPDAKSGGAQAGGAQRGAQDGGAASGSGSQAGVSGGGAKEKPLNAPADTTNGKSSKASDDGSSEATHGQVVVEPGAPVEHDPQHSRTAHTAGGGHE